MLMALPERHPCASGSAASPNLWGRRMDTVRRSYAPIIDDAKRICRHAAEAIERAQSIIAQSQALRVSLDRPILCPRCHRLTAVENDDHSRNSLVWIVCLLCGHQWSVAPKKAR